VSLARPSGTVTFLFTDIEGSTQRWEDAQPAMRLATRRHDELLREVMERHRGYVFKTVGDAFCVAFSDARSALAAAVDAQRTLGAEDFATVDGLRVRMGLHSGAAEERDEDYFGPTVNRVARISDAAHGSQIVLSGITAELVRGDLPAGVALVDLGEFALKGLAAPERIFQVCAEGLPAEHPPLRTGGFVRSNLPIMLTTFVGREPELAELRGVLAEQRVVTIVGTGGAGKTRLAIELATSIAERFPDGIWFVDLAPLTSGTLVADEFAAVLNIRATSASAVLERLVSSLRARTTLLVVDNCEHVIDEAARCIAHLVAHCPQLRVIATSRESLRIAGEHIFAVAPLEVPPPMTGTPNADSVLAYSAVALLVQRAAASSSFRLTNENAVDVVEICRRLDGLPFALELAAPRLLVLSPAELLARLGERFRLLRNEQRGSLPRRQTLSALIEWSYRLLGDDERTLFRSLAVFPGSFSLDSAARVSGDSGERTLDLLSSLVDKSMVVSDAVATSTRFRLFESTRAFAQEQLRLEGERDGTLERFCEAMLALAREALRVLPFSQERPWLDSIELELDNLRAALTETLEAGRDVAAGAEIAAALGFFWQGRRPQEGSHWLQLAREAAGAYPKPLEGRVFLESARVDVTTLQTVPFAQRAVTAFRGAADSAGLGHALEYLGQSLINVGRFADAERALNESVTLLSAQNAPGAGARSRVLRGVAALYARQDDAAAAGDLSDALAELEAGGRKRDAALALQGLAHVALARGRYKEASTLTARGLRYCEELDDPRGMGLLRFELAHALFREGAVDEARANAVESLRLLRDASIPMAFTQASVVLAATLEAGGRLSEGARALGFARAHTDGVAFCLMPRMQLLYDETLERLRSRTTAAAFEEAMKEGGALAPEAIARGDQEENAVVATSRLPMP
jgi:predicted ATPase/class 3 adenylate cyclase